MKLEHGKTYRTRNGAMTVTVNECLPAVFTIANTFDPRIDIYQWTINGNFFIMQERESPLDLVEECKKPVVLEKGKTYTTRDGTQVQIIEQRNKLFVGVFFDQAYKEHYIGKWFENGRYDAEIFDHPLDIIL